MNPFRHLSRRLSEIAVVLPAILFAATAAAQQPAQQQAQQQPQQQQQPQAQAQPGAAPQGQQMIQIPNFVPLVKHQGQAVVNISASRTVEPLLPEDDPFFEFFRRFGALPEPGERQAQGLGSGFIINQDGYILTNAHVVAEADEILVKLTDKREFQAKVIGADPYTDVALLKIDAGNLPTVQIGQPEDLLPGEWVAAIGAPFGFEHSVTAGIVSAKGRMLPDESYVPFIQTDVAVNPGNSGGPLFNMGGEVVGINSIIYSQTGGFMGLSFAIPIDIAMDVAEELRNKGRVTRSRIGVQIQELTRDLAASFGLKEPRGALVAMVEEGAPAEKAGIRPGDIILSIGDQRVENAADLARFVAQTEPGTTVTAEVWRKGKAEQIKITTTELKGPETEAAAPGEARARTAASVGLTVVPIPEAQLANLELDHGILVRSARGVAARAGLRPGDLILRVDDTQVKSVSQFESLLEKKAGDTVALLVRRGPNTLFVPLRVPARAKQGDKQ